MRGVADAQKPRLVPKRQPVDRDSQELDVIEALEVDNAIGEERSQRGNMVAQGAYALRLEAVSGTLGDHIGALPIFAAIEHNQDLAGVDSAEKVVGIGGPARKLEPKHIHRRAYVKRHEAGFPPHQGMAAVGADRQIRADRQLTVLGFRGDARHSPFLFD